MTQFRFAAVAGVGLLAGSTFLAWAEEDRDNPPAQPAPEQLFLDLDADEDGKLLADEIPDDQQRFFERLIRIGDEDGNGELSKEEFLAAMQDRPRDAGPPRGPRDGEGPPRRGPRDGQRPGPNPEQMFERLDQDKDGSISVEEVPERVKPMLERLLKQSEKESGDSLNKDEFVELMKNFRPPFGPEGGRRPEGRPGDDRGPGFRGPDGRGPEGRGPGGRGPGGFGPGFGGPPPMPKFIKELDADNDGKLSKDELSNLADKFDELDGNEDGVLDMAELMGPPPEFAGGPFNRGRGFGPPGQGPGPRGFGPPGGRPGFGPPGGRPAFGPPDGGPGPADAPRRGPNPENFLKRLDKNEDGKLTEDELNDNLKKKFDKIDANGDGAIDLEEVKSMLEKRAQQQKEKRSKPDSE